MCPASPLCLAVAALLSLGTRAAGWPLTDAAWSPPADAALLGSGAAFQAETDSTSKRQTFLRLGRRPLDWDQWLDAGGPAEQRRLVLNGLYPRPARASRLPVPPADLHSYKRYQIRLWRAPVAAVGSDSPGRLPPAAGRG